MGLKRKRRRSEREKELQQSINSLLLFQSTELSIQARERLQGKLGTLDQNEFDACFLILLLRRRVMRVKIQRQIEMILAKKKGFVLPEKKLLLRVATVIETLLCARYTLALFALGKRQLRFHVLACLKSLIDRQRKSVHRTKARYH